MGTQLTRRTLARVGVASIVAALPIGPRAVAAIPAEVPPPSAAAEAWSLDGHLFAHGQTLQGEGRIRFETIARVAVSVRADGSGLLRLERTVGDDAAAILLPPAVCEALRVACLSLANDIRLESR